MRPHILCSPENCQDLELARSQEWKEIPSALFGLPRSQHILVIHLAPITAQQNPVFACDPQMRCWGFDKIKIYREVRSLESSRRDGHLFFAEQVDAIRFQPSEWAIGAVPARRGVVDHTHLFAALCPV